MRAGEYANAAYTVTGAGVGASLLDANSPGDQPNSTLESIASRIEMTSLALHSLSDLLNSHADRVYGPLPTPTNPKDEIEGYVPTPSGQLGMIYLALDALDNALSRVSQAAGRNTTLA